MEDRVGEEFAATVASLTDFGFFVELDVEHVEGLVRADDLGPGHRLVVGALVWPTGRRVQVGQTLTVRLAGVHVQRRQMDFDVVAFAGERPSRRRGGAERVEAPRRERGAAGPDVERGGRPGKQRKAERPRRDGSPDRRTDRAQRDSGARQHAPEVRRETRRTDQQGSRSPQGQRSEPARPETGASPHPGFNRLRALAEQERRAGKRGDSQRGRSDGRHGGSDRSGGGRSAPNKKRRR
jgi:ribonuclease R